MKHHVVHESFEADFPEVAVYGDVSRSYLTGRVRRILTHEFYSDDEEELFMVLAGLKGTGSVTRYVIDGGKYGRPHVLTVEMEVEDGGT